MGRIHLCCPRPKPLYGRQKKSRPNKRPVDETGQVARYEHEEFCGITEAVVTQRNPTDGIVWNVIEKDHPEPEASEEIEPKVPLDRFCIFYRAHGIHRTCKASTKP